MPCKNFKYLILALAISSGTQLVNSFVVPIPNWLGIILALLSGSFLVIFALNRRR